MPKVTPVVSGNKKDSKHPHVIPKLIYVQMYIHSFDKYLLSTYYNPEQILCIGDRTVIDFVK